MTTRGGCNCFVHEPRTLVIPGVCGFFCCQAEPLVRRQDPDGVFLDRRPGECAGLRRKTHSRRLELD